jgi:LysM repeat protein
VSGPDDRPDAPASLGGDLSPTSAEDRLPAGAAARGEAEAAAEAILEVEVDDGRSPREATCPYLRLAAPDGSLGRPYDVGATDHRCVAVGEPLALSDRQQALLCLTASHADCPRYLRALLVIPVTEPVTGPVHRVHPATLVATAILALSTMLAVAFVATNGGLAMPAAPPGPTPTASGVAAASATPPASATPAASPSAAATPSATPAESPSPEPSASATPSPSPIASPTAQPSTTPRPSSDRYKLLEPCPGKPDCYIYTVRAGDNLFSIANYFGVPLAIVYDLNPWLRATGLRAGQQLVLPPPTR